MTLNCCLLGLPFKKKKKAIMTATIMRMDSD